jgi:hypothetical protein
MRERRSGIVEPGRAEQDPGEGDACNGGRRGRTEAPLQRDAIQPVQTEGGNVGAGMDPSLQLDGVGDRAADHVRTVGRELVGALAVPRHSRLGLGVDGHLVAEIERQPEAIEAGSEVRRRRRHADGDAH